MKGENRVVHLSLGGALKQGPPPPGNLAVPIFSHGTLAVELYTPAGHDPQKPHTRDEVYFVARGTGHFFDGEGRQALATAPIAQPSFIVSHGQSDASRLLSTRVRLSAATAVESARSRFTRSRSRELPGLLTGSAFF